MHPTFRTLLKKNGPEKMASSVSSTKYPVSRPDAALADPFKEAWKRGGAGMASGLEADE
jgi:hypothetical protein